MAKATTSQIGYIEILLDKLYATPDEYGIDLKKITKMEAIELIEQLKDDLGWD